MSAENNYFKKYQREMRIQTSEKSFSKGQVYTKAPLATDKVRLIVNYDIIDEGEALSCRKGIYPSLVGVPFKSTELATKFDSNVSLIQAYDAVEEDDKHYRLVVANQFDPDNPPIEGTNLYSAPAELWVIDMDKSSDEFPIFDEYQITSKDMYAIPLSYEIPDAEPFSTSQTYAVNDMCVHNGEVYVCIVAVTVAGAWNSSNWALYEYPQSYYHIPNEPVANGVQIEDTHHLARPVGTFAFGNDYYNFNTNGDLIRSIYHPAESITNQYDPTITYAVGDKCVYNDSYWECNTAISTPEQFNSAHWGAYTPISATFLTEKLTPKSVTALEALSFGFNMLSDQPFDFSDAYNAGTIQLQGMMILNGDSKVTEPLLNTLYKLRFYYTVEQGQVYKIIIDYRETESDSWISIQETEYYMTGAQPPEISVSSFSSPYGQIVIRIRAYRKSGNTYPADPEKTFSMGVNFVQSPSSPVANKELRNYDLSKATGMTYWKNRLWLYGLAQEPTVLFASDINEPTYFPYPTNVDIFDEPVLNALPFNDSLLVFTSSTLYQITLSSEGGWTRKVLQGNLNFTEFDTRFAQVIKNMVFFKSGDYYYMVVPKTLSLQNEFALAPVSKNIEHLLDDFEESASTIIHTLYEYDGSLTLVNHYNYLNYEDIHNVYTFKTDTDLFINLVLLYNTVDRTWRTYTYESQTMYYPFRQDATKTSALMTPAYFTIHSDDPDRTTIGAEFLDTRHNTVKDFYIPYNTTISFIDHQWLPDSGQMDQAFNAIHIFKNYQAVDSGYREYAIDYNKRYRELQFKFNITSLVTLHFITEFILNGETRISQYRYETEHITDPSSPNYGLIYINRIPVENIEIPGQTILAADETDINAWALDNSRFPEIAFWKARLKVSGKGYTPRFRLICRSEENYELLGYTWVYRQLYSR